jgi:hypothetical protein
MFRTTHVYKVTVQVLGSQNVHCYLVHMCGSKHSLMMTPKYVVINIVVILTLSPWSWTFTV